MRADDRDGNPNQRVWLIEQQRDIARCDDSSRRDARQFHEDEADEDADDEREDQHGDRAASASADNLAPPNRKFPTPQTIEPSSTSCAIARKLSSANCRGRRCRRSGEKPVAIA